MAVVFALAKAKHFRSEDETGARGWFYDRNAHRLYGGDLIPPDGNGGARVRAVVIGFQGLGNNTIEYQSNIRQTA